LKIPKRYSEAIVFENFLKDNIFTTKVHCTVHQLSKLNETDPVRIRFFSLWNYGTSVARTSDSSNTFWQSLQFGYIFLMANFQILANDNFIFFHLNLKQLYLFLWYYIDIKTQVNQNFTTSTFLFLGYLGTVHQLSKRNETVPGQNQIFFSLKLRDLDGLIFR
jgi:hypothetical protein